MSKHNFNWDAVSFFEGLSANNKLAQAEGFTFCRVSGLEGFEEALHTMQGNTAFVCVSDIAQGYTELNNPPPYTARKDSVPRNAPRSGRYDCTRGVYGDNA